MPDCVFCEERYPAKDLNGDGACSHCAKVVTRQKQFAELATAAGLSMYPDPTGERYLYKIDGRCAGKKGENTEFMDDLWDALARALGRDDLTIGKE